MKTKSEATEDRIAIRTRIVRSRGPQTRSARLPGAVKREGPSPGPPERNDRIGADPTHTDRDQCWRLFFTTPLRVRMPATGALAATAALLPGRRLEMPTDRAEA